MTAAPAERADEAVTLADEAGSLVFVDPQRARAVARSALETIRRVGDAAVESATERTLGLAERELNHLTAAARHLRRAVAVAERAGLPVAAAEATMSLALVRAMQGDNEDASRLAQDAGRVLRGGLEAARLRMQQALLAERRGQFDEAMAGFAQALSVFRRQGDRLWEAKLLNNRGIMQAYRGRFPAAEADLARAEQLYAELGQDLAVADTRWNRGFAAGRTGAVARALTLLAEAERYYEQRGIPQPLILVDKCEVLLTAGLFAEARQTAARAVAELADGRMAADLAEARLMLAQAALACGDLATADDAARRACRAFVRQGRSSWATVARYVLVRGMWRAGRHDAHVLRRALDGAAELAAAGWAEPALDARLIAADVATRLGRLPLAEGVLAEVAAARRAGSPTLRVGAWQATALLRLAGGDRRGAQAALLAGVRALELYRMTLGATELRVRAAEHGTELVRLGLGLALSDRHAARVLAWAERGRAGSLRHRPSRPPADPRLAADIAALRAATSEREQALAAGEDARVPARLQARLERSVRERWRLIGGDAANPRAAVPTVAALASRLGDRALVEIVAAGDRLHAVVVAGGRATLHRLGAVAEAAAEARALRSAMRREVGAPSAAARAAAAATLSDSADRLDAAVLRPLLDRLGDRELVIVPTGVLHGVPWSTLPSCAGRPVCVAPSAGAWLRAAAGDHRTPATAVVLVAGPGLPDAEEEVAALHREWPGSVRLGGPAAGVEAVLAALDGSRVAHLATHGRFRADNPHFSALWLADGLLNVYDLETLRHPPQLVVLSACNSGLSAVHSGDELIGIAAALLALGTRCLIATVVPVLDASAKEVMLDLHARLRAGVAPAAALAATRGTAARAFVCLGDG